MEERDTLDIALGTAADDVHDVIVLSGLYVDVPMEADLDADPLHAAQLRLERADGSVWVLGVGDPDVGLDLANGRYVYTFRSVTYGRYCISIKLPVDDVWAKFVTGIVVSKKGVFLNGKAMASSLPAAPAPKVEEDPERDGSEYEFEFESDGVHDHALPEDSGGN